MIERLIAELGEKLDLTAEELADIIWLTLIRQQGTITDSMVSKADTATVVVQSSSAVSMGKSMVSSAAPESVPSANRQPTTEPVVGIAPRRSQTTPLDRLPIKVANPPSIRDPLSLARSLRPLMRQVPSGQIEGLDEQATAQQIAEAGIWQPIVKPALEPWLELVLVADESASMLIWRQTVLEFRKLLRNYGAFRDVQLWGLYWDTSPPTPLLRGEGSQAPTTPSLAGEKNQTPPFPGREGRSFSEELGGLGRLCLRPGIGSEALNSAPRQPEEILDPSGRRLIVLITDCVAPHWQSKALIKTLKLWSQHSPVVIAQVLPEWLWVRTAIRGFESVQLAALEPGVPNSQLVIDWSSVLQADPDGKAGVCVPIVPLEPDLVLTWSQMVMGQGEAPGYWLQAFPTDAEESEPASLSLEQRVERFQVMSSPVAQRLMGLVAASPVITLPVIRLIQETLLPKSRQMNVAEVLLGGLLELIEPPQRRANPDEVEYRFVDEAIRDRLLEETPVTDTVRVLSEFVERQFDKSLDEFVAELLVWSQSKDAALIEKTRSFATVTASVLKRKGGKYREFVRQIEGQYHQGLEQDSSASPTVSFPPLQEFNFETARIAFEEEEALQPFEFEVATVEVQHKGWFRRQSQVVIQRERRQAWGYVEKLSETVELEMVAIPEGQFRMGSPQNEPERHKSESPQHEVSVPAFFMGKYPVTQAQWRVVAGLPQVARELASDPSQFKGENQPVENVSWHDATEFCDRLSQLTGKLYRLPSEAQWEYACRAGTTTPFHFGETITPDLANYDWDSTYGSVKVTKEKDFRWTTAVGHFGVGNAFGLYDMHGNVWEWCEDHWHGNYEGAPTDGSAWIDSEAEEDATRVRRGGSWSNYPSYCRSATRFNGIAGIRYTYNGFRVVCGEPSTLGYQN
jgi:formylglycine-generating enzyme required for sulfatase activity